MRPIALPGLLPRHQLPSHVSGFIVAESASMNPIRLLITAWLSVYYCVSARDVVFPPALGVESIQQPLRDDDSIDISTGSEFYGLTTFANLPYVNCFAKSSDDEASKSDIFILGAPFDTVSALYWQ